MRFAAFLLLLIIARIRADDDDFSSFPNLKFVSCVTSKWSCVNKTIGISSTIDSVTYKCDRTTYIPLGYDYDAYGRRRQTSSSTSPETLSLVLSDWQSVQVRQLKVSGCHKMALNMHTTSRSTIESLIIENIDELIIARPTGESTYHPRYISIQSVRKIPLLPAGMVSNSDTRDFRISDVDIDFVEKNAIKPEGKLTNFKWSSVKISGRMKENAISLTMDKDCKFVIDSSQFPVLKPLTIILKGDSPILIVRSTFETLQTAAITAAVPSFVFIENEVKEASHPMYIMSPEVIFENNIFRVWGSPAQLFHWSLFNGDTQFLDSMDTLYALSKLIDTCVFSDFLLMSACRSEPQDVSFWFVGNYLNKGVKEAIAPKRKPPPGQDVNVMCISSVKFLKRSSYNCLELHGEPGDDVFSMPSKNVTVLSAHICKNYAICEDTLKEDCSRLIFVDGDYDHLKAWDPLNLFSYGNCSESENEPLKE